MKRQLELLSPARDLACGIAAIDHGADAVYIGAPRFGARAAAGNSVTDIRELCLYAHQYGAKVYVTVNTLVYDDELAALRLLLRQLAGAGADAVLFQDVAVPLIVREEQLPLSLHASTQTDNRTAEKVRWLSGVGASRVVLARELSVEEVAAIHHRVPGVEIEVFVHGALCVSYSGQCYASQHCFRRSANRGECAQMCRMKYDLTDSDGRILEHWRHLLSLKDLNQSQHLAELIEAGATSLKIEGRLKDMAYVKNVTAAYSQLLDDFIATHHDAYERASLGRCRYTFTPDLSKTFNRGYTTYFLHGRQHAIFSPDTPKAMGEFVGTVKSVTPQHGLPPRSLPAATVTVAGTAAFSNGDGLCFIDENRELQGFRVNRADGNRLTVAGQLPPGLRRGARLYRNSDQQMERQLSRKSAERKIPVTLSLGVTPGGYELTMEVDGRSGQQLRATAQIACEHQQAQKPQRENIIRELTKLGNTPYECSTVNLPPHFDFFIPASRLSELRRNTLKILIINGQSSGASTESGATRGSGAARDSGSAKDSGGDRDYGTTPYFSNSIALEFYRSLGMEASPAFELREPDGEKMLMQCRHCLRYALGHCTRHGDPAPSWHEPLFLTLANGTRFRLHFDCKNCQMEVYST